MKKLAILVTHPIQYYVPVFQLLAQQCTLKVFYTWGEAGIKPKYDPDFGKTISWDLPLLEGYDYELLDNTASDPGSHHGKGIVNPGIFAALEHFKPDAILVYGYIYHSHFQVMRHFKGKTPVWFRGDSTLLDPLPWYKKLIKRLYLRWIYSYVDKAFYVGQNNKAYFKEYGLKENQLVFAPHAVDNDRFAKSRKTEADELRAKLNMASDDILILFAGKLELKKNPELLLQAFLEISRESEVRRQKSEVESENEQRTKNKEQPTMSEDRSQKSEVESENEQRTKNKEQPTMSEDRSQKSEDKFENELQNTNNKKRPQVHLLFVGNGALEKSLTLKVESLKAKQQHTNIHFLDFQNQTQMPVVYQACDVFCLPSTSETWGLAINEAMATGKAIIASDKVGCSVDLIKSGTNGFSFRDGDLLDLVSKLDLVIDPKLNTEFGLQSLNMITQWSFAVQVESLKKNLNETA